MKPIVSSRYLAYRLGVPLPKLRELAKNIKCHYRKWPKTDPTTGKCRVFKVPDDELKHVQRQILKLLSQYPLPDSAHGGVKNRSPRTNAEQHLGQPWLVNMDIRDFFPSVDHRQVAKMFRSVLQCGRETTWLLTRLTTIDGELPQGAPTSTIVANMLLAMPIDEPMKLRAAESGTNYSRFVDDMAFSGSHPTHVISPTAKAISRLGLRIWRKRRKLKITPRSQRQEVTGYTVNSRRGPSIARAKRDKIRAAIHGLKFIQNEQELDKALRSVNGRINHLQEVNPGAAVRMRRQLNKTLQAGKTRHPKYSGNEYARVHQKV